MKTEKANRLFFFTLVTAILLVSFIPLTSYALDYNWFGGTGSWEYPSNWSPYGLPGETSCWDDVYITNAPDINATAYFSGVGYPGNYAEIRSLKIYGTGEGTMTVLISGGTLLVFFYPVEILNKGVITQTGGSFWNIPNDMTVGTGGTYNLEAGVFRLGEHTLQVYGAFNQTGGTVGTIDAVYVREGGVYNLSGTGQVSTNFAPNVIFAGGVFNQYGGTISGLSTDVIGTYNLIAGELRSDGYRWWSNYVSGTFNQSGGTTLWERTDPVSPPPPVSLHVGYDYTGTKTDGTYNLSGGRLEATGILVGDRFNYSGGEMVLREQTAGSWVSGTLTNNGTVLLNGSGTRVIDGNVINSGTFKTTHTTAVYTGTFTNNGAYISDPATQYFNDLIIAENGYLVGQYNDYFYINANFINNSTMNTDWNTMHSNLSFITGVDNLHDLYLTGVDYGAAMFGYSNNFSWGELNITGNILALYDGNDIAGGALYLREIMGLDISGNMIANIFGMDGLNIYYMANLKENDYLGRSVYDLSGGGHLIPIKTPEPSTMLLLGSGLLGLLGMRKKFKK